MSLVLRDLAPAQKKSLSEEVLGRLREMILRGRFRPGDQLSETMLAEAFGVSRGPVREALSQLQQEGLVVLERRRGARVTRISQEDVEELYELRISPEQLAIKRAVRRITGDELARMGSLASSYGDAVGERAIAEAVDIDMKFHDLIYQAARHTRLYSCWSNLLHSQIHTFVLSCSLVDPVYMEPCVPEHVEICDALRDQDRERAAKLIDSHLRSAHERLLNTPLDDG